MVDLGTSRQNFLDGGMVASKLTVEQDDEALRVAAGERPVVFFDGECNLCNGFVDFVMRHDREARFAFASLQGVLASHLTVGRDSSDDHPSTILLFDGDRVYRRSEAVLRVLLRLRGWPRAIGRIGLLFPRVVRDRAYTIVARHRYGWFGKRDTCRLPSPEERDRLLP